MLFLVLCRVAPSLLAAAPSSTVALRLLVARGRVNPAREQDLSLDVGLSSSGRLYDLFVKLEAMSPSEFKTKGAGLRIWYGIHETPFGLSLIATTSRGICNLRFLDAISQRS